MIDEDGEPGRTTVPLAEIHSAHETLTQVHDLRDEAQHVVSTATDPVEAAGARALLDQLESVETRTKDRLAEKLTPEPVDGSAVEAEYPPPAEPLR